VELSSMSRPYSIADIWFAVLDPVWGTEGTARLANADTHHYTNSCPQVHSFNDMTWGDLGLMAKLFDLADARDDSARKHLHDLASSLSSRLRWDYRNFAFLYQSYSIASASTRIVYSPAEIACQHAHTSQQ
jgi:hypothetical protein